MPDLALHSTRMVVAGAVQEATLIVRRGVIEELAGEPPEGALDLGDLVVMPGLIDTHVHVNEPGRTEWEGFETATRAAAAGGVTTLLDMPLNSLPPTTSREALLAKRAAAEGKCRVNVGFWGGAIPDNLDQLEGLVWAGAFGFKCFLVPSGVDEFPHLGEEDLRRIMPVLAGLEVPFLVHAELPGPIDEAVRPAGADPRNYLTYLASRPKEAENQAVDLLIELCRELGTRVHVVHLSSAEALRSLAEARQEGLPITVETCPHYLFFSAEDVPEGATEFKCAPPIRERDNRDGLWASLARGTIDQIVSDHSPCPPDLKLLPAGDFLSAWGGISSLQLGLPAVWTAARHRGHSLQEVVEWMSAAPARLSGLEGRKGRIAEGYDADLVAWDPEASFLVEPDRLHHRHPLTPYAGRILHGVVEKTFLRGAIIYDEGRFVGEPSGELLV
ncbi:MAG: allantoinase AllB [Acidimicrobiia bacterium]